MKYTRFWREADTFFSISFPRGHYTCCLDVAEVDAKWTCSVWSGGYHDCFVPSGLGYGGMCEANTRAMGAFAWRTSFSAHFDALELTYLAPS